MAPTVSAVPAMTAWASMVGSAPCSTRSTSVQREAMWIPRFIRYIVTTPHSLTAFCFGLISSPHSELRAPSDEGGLSAKPTGERPRHSRKTASATGRFQGASGGTRTHKPKRSILSRLRIPFRHGGQLFYYKLSPALSIACGLLHFVQPSRHSRSPRLQTAHRAVCLTAQPAGGTYHLRY